MVLNGDTPLFPLQRVAYNNGNLSFDLPIDIPEYDKFITISDIVDDDEIINDINIQITNVGAKYAFLQFNVVKDGLTPKLISWYEISADASTMAMGNVIYCDSDCNISGIRKNGYQVVEFDCQFKKGYNFVTRTSKFDDNTLEYRFTYKTDSEPTLPTVIM